MTVRTSIFVGFISLVIGFTGGCYYLSRTMKPEVQVEYVEKIVYKDVKPKIIYKEIPVQVPQDPDTVYVYPTPQFSQYALVDTVFSGCGRLTTSFSIRDLIYTDISFYPFPIESRIVYKEKKIGFFKTREFGFLVGTAVVTSLHLAFR